MLILIITVVMLPLYSEAPTPEYTTVVNAEFDETQASTRDGSAVSPSTSHYEPGANMQGRQDNAKAERAALEGAAACASCLLGMGPEDRAWCQHGRMFHSECFSLWVVRSLAP